MEKMRFNSTICGYLIGFMTIGYSFGGFAASRLVVKYGVKMTLKMGLALTLLSSLLLLVSFMWSAANLIFLVAAFFFQSGMAIVHPPSTTTAIRFFSDLRGSASAVRGTFSILASALGAAIAAYLGGSNISYVAILAILASLLAFSLSRRSYS